MNEPFSGPFSQAAGDAGCPDYQTLAQVGAVVLLKMPEHAGKLVFAGIHQARFRRRCPGDVLRGRWS